MFARRRQAKKLLKIARLLRELDAAAPAVRRDWRNTTLSPRAALGVPMLRPQSRR